MAIEKYNLSSGESRYKATLWKNSRKIGSQSFIRKQDAVLWLSKKNMDAVDLKVGRMKGANLCYDEFFKNIYLTRKAVSAGTAMDYISLHTHYVLQNMGARQISSIEADEWSQHFSNLMQGGLSPQRTNRLHTAVSAVYKMAVDLKYVNENPMKSIPWNSELITDFDYWSRNELEEFLTFAVMKPLPMAIVYQVAYESGLRLSEIIGLKKDCVDFHNDLITVRRKYCNKSKKIIDNTKSGCKRIIGLNPGLKSLLRQMMNFNTSEFVFCDASGNHLSYDHVIDSFERDIKKSGVRRIRFHDLRHTFASHFTMNGGSVYDLKEILGHADIKTTMRYAHLAADHVKSKSHLVSFNCPSVNNVVHLQNSKV